jgi:hypothetical protein
MKGYKDDDHIDACRSKFSDHILQFHEYNG